MGIKMVDDITVNIKNVSFCYEAGKNILIDISINACGDENIGLIGANGVGKSTLLKLLVGLNLGFQGDIEIEGIPVTKKNLAGIREKIGYVFQDSESQLFMSNVYDEIAFAPRNYGLSEGETEKRVENAMKSIHIEYLRGRQIYKMSSVWMRIILPADVTVTEESPQHNFTFNKIIGISFFRLLSCRSFMMYRNGCPTLMLSGVGSKQPEQNTNIAASLYSLSFSTVLFPSNPGIRISIKIRSCKISASSNNSFPDSYS